MGLLKERYEERKKELLVKEFFDLDKFVEDIKNPETKEEMQEIIRDLKYNCQKYYEVIEKILEMGKRKRQQGDLSDFELELLENRERRRHNLHERLKRNLEKLIKICIENNIELPKVLKDLNPTITSKWPAIHDFACRVGRYFKKIETPPDEE